MEHFRSPDAAARALLDAAAAMDKARLNAIFGPDGADVISSGDEVADKASADRFVAASKEKRTIVDVSPENALLEVGNDDWAFPIPIVKTSAGWCFDTAAGKDELVNRRIGKNEIHTVNACLSYVDAQRDYANRMRTARGTTEYAQKIRSTPGRRDGLYWEVRTGERDSPLGPLFADASGEGYAAEASDSGPQPFHGYLFRVLSAQGVSAPGGKKNYLRGAHMNDGFALAAYPAEYGNSGVMTFVVNRLGVVFQKDLGQTTGEITAAMKEYNPDATWDPVEPVALLETPTATE